MRSERPTADEVGRGWPGAGAGRGAGDDEHLVGVAAPEGADDEDALVGVDDAVPGVLLGVDGGAQQAAAGEAGEAGLLLGELAGHERHPEQLAVGVLDRGAGLAPGVDDGLAVAQARHRRVLLDPVPDGRHDEHRLLVGDVFPAVVVLGGEHEDLVDPSRRRLGEHGPTVLHHEGVVALEGGVEVGHHPDQPVAARAVGLEGRGGGLLVAGAEGAGPGGVGLDGGRGWRRRRAGATGRCSRPPSGR